MLPPNLHIPALAAVDEAEGRHSWPGAGYKSALCHVALALAEVDKHIQVAAAAADTSLPTYVKAQFVFFQSKFNSFLSSDVIFLDEKLSEMVGTHELPRIYLQGRIIKDNRHAYILTRIPSLKPSMNYEALATSDYATGLSS